MVSINVENDLTMLLYQNKLTVSRHKNELFSDNACYQLGLDADNEEYPKMGIVIDSFR